jgi:hypothetical protein
MISHLQWILPGCLSLLFTATVWNQTKVDNSASETDEFSHCTRIELEGRQRVDSVGAKEQNFARPANLEMSSRGGARIEVYLKDGSMVYGDLLSVCDTMLSTYCYVDFSYLPPPHARSGVRNIGIERIQKIVIKGRSKVLEGAFIGFLGGMIAGSVFSRVINDRELGNGLAGPGAMAGIGLTVGGAIGYLNSTDDLVIGSFGQDNLAALNALSRYPTIAPK